MICAGLSPPVRRRPFQRWHPDAPVSPVESRAIHLHSEGVDARAAGVFPYTILPASSVQAVLLGPALAAVAFLAGTKIPARGRDSLGPRGANKKPGTWPGSFGSLLNTRRNDRMQECCCTVAELSSGSCHQNAFLFQNLAGGSQSLGHHLIQHLLDGLLPAPVSGPVQSLPIPGVDVVELGR